MDMIRVPGNELTQRLRRFLLEMDNDCGNWELCAITGASSLFYLTGTICDGMLLLRRGGDCTLWVRRNYDRSVLESEFPDIRPMGSFRDVAASVGSLPDTLYLDTAHATMEWYSLLSKYLPFKNVLPLDGVMLKVRAVKSEYELARVRMAGSAIGNILMNELPPIMSEGISEAMLGAQLLTLFIKSGHHGVSKFNMRNTSELLGHICFGDSSLFPGVFNGASGIAGLCPAVPALGSFTRYLREGDLVFIDVCFGVEGYNVDKTLVYSYRHKQPDYIIDAHKHCLDLQQLAASLLRTGSSPSDIYEEVLAAVAPEYRHRFMGVPGRTVPFIGHSVGLYVDETPVLAKGFNSPLQSGMTIAIEPKMGFEGIGMVGAENTYLVTGDGGVSLTGPLLDIITVA
ncbi:MAG: M24 family metallopeptidase [Oscillospiraceae bacterium]|nr:M24 family metallopeptidase [Oscillospiraceae bacterium]